MSLCESGLSCKTHLYWIASRLWRGLNTTPQPPPEEVIMGRVIGMINALRELTDYAHSKRNHHLHLRATNLLGQVVEGKRKRAKTSSQLPPIANLQEYRWALANKKAHKARQQAACRAFEDQQKFLIQSTL